MGKGDFVGLIGSDAVFQGSRLNMARGNTEERRSVKNAIYIGPERGPKYLRALIRKAKY
jgi:hypothetical protein